MINISWDDIYSYVYPPLSTCDTRAVIVSVALNAIYQSQFYQFNAQFQMHFEGNSEMESFSDVYSYFMMITRLIAEEHGADSATCSLSSAILGQKLTLKSDSECCRSCHWICRIIVARHFDHMECGGKWNDNLVVVFPARTIDLSPFWHFV